MYKIEKIIIAITVFLWVLILSYFFYLGYESHKINKELEKANIDFKEILIELKERVAKHENKNR